MTEYSFIHTIQWQLDNKLLVCHFKKMKKMKKIKIQPVSMQLFRQIV